MKKIFYSRIWNLYYNNISKFHSQINKDYVIETIKDFLLFELKFDNNNNINKLICYINNDMKTIFQNLIMRSNNVIHESIINIKTLIIILYFNNIYLFVKIML